MKTQSILIILLITISLAACKNDKTQKSEQHKDHTEISTTKPKYQAPKDVHTSIKDFVKLAMVIKFDRHLVRVDELGNNKFRYTSWDSPEASMSEKPALIVDGGSKVPYGNAGNFKYEFPSGKFQYEIDRLFEKEASMPDVYLRVYRNGDESNRDDGVIIYEDLNSKGNRTLKDTAGINKAVELENKILSIYSEIENKSSNDISYVNGLTQIYKLLSNTLKSNPGTFDYSFTKLKDKNIVNIFRSKDNNLKIYSWESLLGGTMKSYSGVYQVRNNNQVFTYDENSDGLVRELHSVKGKEVYYITKTLSSFSTKKVAQSINAFKIANNKLEAVKIFKTSKDAYSSISVDYDYFKALDAFPKEKDDVIRINDKGVQLRVISANEDFTDKFLNYVWKEGEYIYEGLIE